MTDNSRVSYKEINFTGHETSSPYAIGFAIVVMILALTGCMTDTPDTVSVTPDIVEEIVLPQSDWGTVTLIAQAEHQSAPVFTEIPNGTIFTWTGSQDGEARHFSQGTNGSNQIVALSADFPMQQQLFPIENGALLLWLDRTDTSIDMRLQAGTLNEAGVAMVGSVSVSDGRTRNYDAIAIDDEQIRIVWSGGSGEVTNLYLHHIDHQARPLSGGILHIDADYPAMIRDNEGMVHLFWLENSGRDAYHARFGDSASPILVDIQRVASADIAGTDAISDFSAGFDGTYAYLFWNIRRTDDSRVVLMSSGQLTDEDFSPPTALETENGAIQWLYPLQETQNPLPVVANQSEDLLLLWMQNGELSDSEWIAGSGQLIGLPFIAPTNTGLGVSWSQITGNGYANLFTVIRP